MSFLGFLISFAQRHTSHYSPFHQHMAKHSYRTYLLHMTVVIFVQLGLLQWTSLLSVVVLLLGLVISIPGSHLASLAVGSNQSTAAKLLKKDANAAQLQPEVAPAD